MGSANGPSIVDQLQMDDDMNRIQYSAEYSADINSKMQMPSRLSLEPEQESFIEDEQPESNLQHSGMAASPAHGMNVPERILLAGSGSHVGMRESPRDLDLGDLSSYPRGEQAVELTTPPRTLTLDEFHFPTVGTERKDTAAAAKKLAGIADDSAITDVANQSLEEPNPYNLQKQIRLLTRKVSDLEDRQNSREYRETIFMVATALYFLYKGFRYFTSSHY